MKTWPTLYTKTNTGAIQGWRIWVVETAEDGIGMVGNIWTEFGQVGGKLQTTSDAIKEGKNPGKKNETTALEQALKEAEAKWKKKIARDGYVEDIERARNEETDQAGGVQPMLAQPQEKCLKHIKFPIDAQRKYNGVRCIAIVENGKCTLWSRKQTPILGMPHIIEMYEQIEALKKGRFVFDGEIYCKGWPLQLISGYCRKQEAKEGYEELCHNVYDMPSFEGPWVDRCRAIEKYVGGLSPVIRVVQTVTLDMEDQIKPIHDRFVKEGYEGVILRNRDAKYEFGKRSYNLIKVKSFLDAEFEIVAVNDGRGKFEGKAIFTVKTDEGKTFECCAPGTMEDRARYLQMGDKLLGKQLTVKYFELSEDRIPIFPVGIAVRDYE